MRFDRTKFFDGYRQSFGSLNQGQVDGLNAILAAVEQDIDLTDVRWLAYMLATTKHETADTFKPIEEYGKGKGHSYGNIDPATGKAYYGRGYVQLTWDYNYKKAGNELGMGDDLYLHPEKALDPPIAFPIMATGMSEGWFTGKKLGDYIHGSTCDYKNSRKIINGLDQADKIAGYAKSFEQILKNSAAAPVDQPVPSGDVSVANVPAGSSLPTESAEVVPSPSIDVQVESPPKGDPPTVAPTQVSRNGPLANYLFSGGGLAALGTAIWGFIQGHLNAGAIGIICLTLLILALIFRGAITDAIRMQTAADPDKKNVT